MSTPPDKFKCEHFGYQAEGVAAPLEPTPPYDELRKSIYILWKNSKDSFGQAGMQQVLRDLIIEWAAAVSKNLQPDWLTIATMMCLNIDMTKGGEVVLPYELAKYMADIHKQIEAGKSPR